MKKILLLLLLISATVGANAQWKRGRVIKSVKYYNYELTKGNIVNYSENRDGTITVFEQCADTEDFFGTSGIENVVEFTGFFYGQIRDPVDNYVNVRKGPGTNYAIVDQKYVGSCIYFQKTNTNWLKVYEEEYLYDEETWKLNHIGYVYKDRIKTPTSDCGINRVKKEKEPIEWTKNLCPDNNHPHAIDLGIGVKWACCNVGAKAPNDNGDYYAWGETTTKKSYGDDDTWDQRTNGIGSDIAGTKYDVAHVKWGGTWRMPNELQMKKLVEKCKYQWAIIDGVKGGLLTGPNGNSIFLPATGWFYVDHIEDFEERAIYLNSSNHWDKISIDSYEIGGPFGGMRSDFGFPVRPVSQ